MRIITKPTCEPGEECDGLLSLVSDESMDDAKAELMTIVQLAFEAGMGVNQPQPIVEAPKPVATKPKTKSTGKLPAYRRVWKDIDEDAPQNKIEAFIYRDMPNAEANGANPEGWLTRFEAALKYVANN